MPRWPTLCFAPTRRLPEINLSYFSVCLYSLGFCIFSIKFADLNCKSPFIFLPLIPRYIPFESSKSGTGTT